MVVKSHMRPWADGGAVLCRHSDIAFVCIERDPVAVAMSAYRHYHSMGWTDGDLEEFYWSDGRHVLDFVRRYNRGWRRLGATFVRYEDLLLAFSATIEGLSRRLGLQQPDSKLLESNTSKAALIEKYGERVGGVPTDVFFSTHADEFTDSIEPSRGMLDDIAQVWEHGIGHIQRYRHSMMVRLRNPPE